MSDCCHPADSAPRESQCASVAIGSLLEWKKNAHMKKKIEKTMKTQRAEHDQVCCGLLSKKQQVFDKPAGRGLEKKNQVPTIEKVDDNKNGMFFQLFLVAWAHLVGRTFFNRVIAAVLTTSREHGCVILFFDHQKLTRTKVNVETLGTREATCAKSQE